MQITFLKGYPDMVGRRRIFAGYGNGPASYVLTGDPVIVPGYETYIDALFSALSVSGNYEVKFEPAAYGARQPWNALWTYSGKQGVNTVVQNAAGTGMTPGVIVPITFSGTGGATGTVTVLTATTISIQITNTGSYPGGAPTATVAGTGGTPPTLTVTTVPASGNVPITTNLSGETVQFGGFIGQY